MAVTPQTKRNSLTVYTEYSYPKEKESLLTEIDFKRERKSSDTKISSKDLLLNQFEYSKINKSDVEESSSCSKEIPKDEKTSKNFEKNSDSIFKGLLRRFAMRRSSKDMGEYFIGNKNENINTMPEIKERLSKIDSDECLKISESSSLASDMENDLNKKFTTEVHLTITNNFSQDLLDEVDKVTETSLKLHDNNKCFSSGHQIKDFSEVLSDKQFNENNDKVLIPNSNEKNFELSPNCNQTTISKDAAISKTVLNNKVQDMIKNFNTLSQASKFSYKSKAKLEIEQGNLNTSSLEIRKNILDADGQYICKAPFISNLEQRQKFKNDTRKETDKPFLSEKKLFLGGKNNSPKSLRGNSKKIDYLSESNKEDFNTSLGKSEKENGNDIKYAENGALKITWSVSALKERYEILNTVHANTDDGFRHSWRRNSINKRKEMRNSIRRRKTLEGESRRATIKRSFRKNTNVCQDKDEEPRKFQIPEIKISNAETNEISLYEDCEIKREGNINSGSAKTSRSNSFNSNRSIIVSKDHRRLKSLKSSSSLKSPKRSLVKSGKKRPNSIVSGTLGEYFPITSILILKNVSSCF